MTASGDLTYCQSNTGNSGFDTKCSTVALSSHVDSLSEENQKLEEELQAARQDQTGLESEVAAVKAALVAEKEARAKDAEVATAALVAAEAKTTLLDSVRVYVPVSALPY